MKWTQSQPTPSAIWTTDQLAYHLRLDPDVAQQASEQAFITDLQATAVEYAETAMGCSLLTRAVTATFYGPNAPTNFGYLYGHNWQHRLRLPRGPILSGITSVTDANGTIDSSKYHLEGEGSTDLLRITIGYVAPVTVVYTAGYGNTASSVPADIRQALRMHIGTLYENRESIGVGKSADAIPHSLQDFYRIKARNVPVG
jgi:uncharacterized phiE125 gp8 family phage protein